jgi:hypothetical protein
MLKISLKYGLICSIFLIIIFHVSDFYGINPLLNLSHVIFDLFVLGVFIFFGIKEYRVNQDGGSLHFWQGMSIGINIYFIAATVFSIYLLIFLEWNDDVVNAYKESTTNFYLENRTIYEEKIGTKAFEEILNGVETIKASSLVISSALKKIIPVFFITLMISIILRKQLK